jgi:hypothetical protein
MDILFLKNAYSTKQDENILETFKNEPQFDIYFLMTLIVSLLIAYLAYCCNENLGKPSQIFFTILAFIFSGIYFIFYLIYHVIMGVPCP